MSTTSAVTSATKPSFSSQGPDVQKNILSYLDVESLSNVSKVSKAFQTLCSQPQVWLPHLTREFPTCHQRITKEAGNQQELRKNLERLFKVALKIVNHDALEFFRMSYLCQSIVEKCDIHRRYTEEYILPNRERYKSYLMQNSDPKENSIPLETRLLDLIGILQFEIKYGLFPNAYHPLMYSIEDKLYGALFKCLDYTKLENWKERNKELLDPHSKYVANFSLSYLEKFAKALKEFIHLVPRDICFFKIQKELVNAKIDGKVNVNEVFKKLKNDPDIMKLWAEEGKEFDPLMRNFFSFVDQFEAAANGRETVPGTDFEKPQFKKTDPNQSESSKDTKKKVSCCDKIKSFFQNILDCFLKCIKAILCGFQTKNAEKV